MPVLEEARTMDYVTNHNMINVCLSFFPWSILNLKERSGRVILAELNSFPSHSSLSLDNPLTHCTDNISSCLEGSDATFISILHTKNTNTVSKRIIS